MATLFYDTAVQFLDAEAISTHARWHPVRPLCAIASYSATHGGSVTLFAGDGRPLADVTYPVHRSAQATALAWHPRRRLLCTGWENGQLYAWGVQHPAAAALQAAGKPLQLQREFVAVAGPHQAPIGAVEFSERGGRMVTADASGVLVGWRCAETGGGGGRDGGSNGSSGGGGKPVHFLTMFTLELGVPVMSVAFRQTVASVETAQLSSLAK